MTKPKTITLPLIILLGICSLGLYGQSGTVSGGSKATGPGGSADYTIGQVIYIPATGPTGGANHGLQQPFVIQAITGINETWLDLSFQMYPNPTTEYIVLNIRNENFSYPAAYYTIFNLQGVIVMRGEIKEKQTHISMKELVPSTYFLKTFTDNTEIKTFRVIKN